MADKSNDPVAMWQNRSGEMEKGFNSFANQAMASPEFSKVVNQVGGVTAGAPKKLGGPLGKYPVGMNLPSRAPRRGGGTARGWQASEGQVNEIKAMRHGARSNPGAVSGRRPAPRNPPPSTRGPW